MPWGFILFLNTYKPNAIETLEALLKANHDSCVAVGEIGLDATLDVDFNLQLEVFESQLALAQTYDLPVIIHHRKTHHHIIRLLKQYPLRRRGCIHAFSGSVQDAMNYVDLGFALGVGGTITYPRGDRTRTSLARVPIDYLLLETDGPTMPVCGYQGQRNQPDRLIHIRDALAEVKELEPEELERHTDANFKRYFIEKHL